uniref:Uncharacterized protein LOC104247626 n=1 Tax=Nicotiana sylvestris TaxID=4096 RepID=A0A1U7YJ58_NICSY
SDYTYSEIESEAEIDLIDLSESSKDLDNTCAACKVNKRLHKTNTPSRDLTALIKKMSTNKVPTDIASTSGIKQVDQTVLTHVQRPPEVQDFKFKSLGDLADLLDKKLSGLNIRPIDLSKNFADKIEIVSDYKTEMWSELNKLKGLIKTNSFTGQLRGWWDNYLSVEEKATVINSTAIDEGVDNIGMALVKGREDVVYTLILTILEYFNDSDYTYSEIESEAEIDLIDLSESSKDLDNTCAACKGDICTCDDDEFYILQSQFQDLNIITITSDNVIEVLKEITDEKILNKRLHKTNTPSRDLTALIKKMSTNKVPTDIASTSGIKQVDQTVLTHVQRPPEVQDFKFKSLGDLADLLDKKLSGLNIRPIDLSKNFADKIEIVSDYKTEMWSELNKLKGLIKTNSFTGQLRGWWDNYLSVEEKATVINSTAIDEGVDNIGMALVKGREDVVYTLILTILEYFNDSDYTYSEIESEAEIDLIDLSESSKDLDNTCAACKVNERLHKTNTPSRDLTALIKKMSTNKGPTDIASTSGIKQVDQTVLTHVQRPPEVQDFKFKSLDDLADLLDKKLSELNKLKGLIKTNSKYADKPRMQAYYYSRPTPQDVLIEERDWNQTNTSYNGFTGQLRGWWDNYLSDEEKTTVINSTAVDEGVDNIGMALVKVREDVVYTLILTILEYFNGRFTNGHETVYTLLNGLRCRTLSEFRWYKDTFMSRVMELPENKYEHWKAMFIDDLPSLFAERVRKALRGSYGEILYGNYTYGISEFSNEKGKAISDKIDSINENSDMFLGMMQVVTAHKWYIKCTILIDNTFSLTNVAMIDSGAD